jgi:hypothetical protein
VIGYPRYRRPQTIGHTLTWGLTILLVMLIPEDAFSENLVNWVWDGGQVLQPVPGLPEEPSVFEEIPKDPAQEASPPVTTAAAKAMRDNPSFKGAIVAGAMVTNRDEKTGGTLVVRIDTSAKLKVIPYEYDQWRPLLRTSIEFSGYPEKGPDLGDPTTVDRLDFYASLSERLFDGFEAGFGGGFAVSLGRGRLVAGQKSPAKWDLHGRFYSGNNYLKVGIGQDQVLSQGWNGSASVRVEGQYEVKLAGALKPALRGDVTKSIYSDGDTIARLAVVLKWNSK